MGGREEGARVSEFFNKESKKKIFFRGGGRKREGVGGLL